MKTIEPKISFEFFPPQTPEGMAKLHTTHTKLAELEPYFFSVTYGAGGSTRNRTLEAVLEVQKSGYPVAPHLSCIAATHEFIESILHQYKEAGVRRIVTLRGDLPSGTADAGAFRYASELVAFIRKKTGDYFTIEVAAYPEYHPQARSPIDDLRAFKTKVEAGANSAITQYFYNFDAYAHFVDNCRAANIDIPIVPGIMPIAGFSRLARFSDQCGAEIPRWMRKQFEGYGDDNESIRAFGLDVVTSLCERLLAAGVPGLHFYTMNQSPLTVEICRRLKLGQDRESEIR